MKTAGRKILVVDDNIEFIDFIRRFLESKEFQISVALDGKTALEKALLDTPDLVLLDLMLPDIPGEGVLKRLKEINKEIAVVIITGHGGEQIAVDLMRKGAIDFLSKPIEHDALLSSVKNALEIRDVQIEDRRFDRYPSLERFFPFLAHEIRNPLHAISGALAIIQRRSDMKDHLLNQSIKIINEEVHHLNEFVQECLNFVRPPNVVHFVSVEIPEIISVVINIISHIYESESKKIRIITDMDPHLPKIYANYEEIKQAFLNIIKNAFEAMPEGGEFTIKACVKSDSQKHVEITFKDNGAVSKKKIWISFLIPFLRQSFGEPGWGWPSLAESSSNDIMGKFIWKAKEKKGTTLKVELPVSRRLGD